MKDMLLKHLVDIVISILSAAIVLVIAFCLVNALDEMFNLDNTLIQYTGKSTAFIWFLVLFGYIYKIQKK